jgi:hypothetical protein
LLMPGQRMFQFYCMESTCRCYTKQ